jgi:hypothetical protein
MSFSKDIAARNCSRSSTGKREKTSSITSCGRPGRELGDLLGVERLGRGNELVGIHRRDERLAHRIGDLEQYLAVALRLDELPDVKALVEGKRFQNVGNVGGMQPVEPSLQRRLAFLVDGALCELGSLVAIFARPLVLDQAFDEPVLAQQRRHVGERSLHARARAR